MDEVLIIGVVVLLAFLVFVCDCYMNSGPSVKITWFYRDSCGYCVKMKDEWAKFDSLAPPSISLTKVDIANPKNARLVKEYKVSGVPHIVKEKCGRREVYSGPRTTEHFLEWSMR